MASNNRVQKEPFGTISSGKVQLDHVEGHFSPPVLGSGQSSEIHKYVLRNASGIQITLTEYGAHILSVLTPDAPGKLGEITLGFDTLDEYQKQTNYIGKINLFTIIEQQ